MPSNLLFPELWMWLVAAAVLGVIVGVLVAAWAVRLTPLVPPRPASDRWFRWLTPLATAAAFVIYVGAVVGWRTHMLDDVRPDEFGWHCRIAYHLILIAFLIAATVTDLRDYVIPDAITVPGTLIGIAGAFAFGQLQLMHVWVDWNLAVPGISGPWTPAWIDHSRHWHGLAVSVCGLVAGAGMTWLVRFLSHVILGREALGFGDVTLMGMIGSYLGWQPMVFVFLLAPFCGLIIGLATRILGGRSYVPYGPFLAAAAFMVLCSWRAVWMLEVPFEANRPFSMRHLFGDAPGLAILAGIAGGAFVVLLLLLRGYRSMPVTRRAGGDTHS